MKAQNNNVKNATVVETTKAQDKTKAIDRLNGDNIVTIVKCGAAVIGLAILGFCGKGITIEKGDVRISATGKPSV